MAKVDMRDEIADAIYRYHEAIREPSRPYLGASQIGEECERRLWYLFRWAVQEHFEGRMLRLFETGRLQEQRVYDELRATGLEVIDIDRKTGEQFRFVDETGHFSGGCDGLVRGVPGAEKAWHLLEIKTSNRKRFDDLKAKGLQKSNPRHYLQMQIYMSKFSVERGLYLCVCKDTDEIYTERVRLDPDVAKSVESKALRIINAVQPPRRISERPDWWQCKFCPAIEACHGQQVADVNCRTCVHSTPAPGGKWMCERYNCEIPEEKQRVGCRNHLHIPDLVPFAEPIDSGEDWAMYQRKSDGLHFVEAGESGFPAHDVPHYSSRELRSVAPASIGDPAVESARKILEGESVE